MLMIRVNEASRVNNPRIKRAEQPTSAKVARANDASDPIPNGSGNTADSCEKFSTLARPWVSMAMLINTRKNKLTRDSCRSFGGAPINQNSFIVNVFLLNIACLKRVQPVACLEHKPTN